MKKIVLSLLLALIYNALCSQDLINSNDNNTSRKKENYTHFRIAVAGGYSHRIINRHIRKDGFNYGLESNYYFNQYFGIGFNYSAGHFNSSDEFFGKTRIQHFVPTFCTRMFDQKKGGLLTNVGIGFIHYIHKHKGLSLTQYGWTSRYYSDSDMGLCALFSIGYDVPFSKTMAVFFQTSFAVGLSELINDVTGWGRLNLSIGLRFAK